MAGHVLIDDYLAAISGRLPSDTIDELGDGLTEAWLQRCAAGVAPDDAAHGAVTEFGRPDQIVDEFVAQSPGRRAARLLLATGPVVAVCWGATIGATGFWSWPGAPAVAVAFGLGLTLVVTTLVTAASSRHSYRRTRFGAAGAVGTLVLDIAVLGGVLLWQPALVWPLAAAVAASIARVGLVLRVLPGVVAH